MVRFEKAYVGVVQTVGMMYNFQEYFHTEGYFKVKSTPLEANICLLEEKEVRLKLWWRKSKGLGRQWFSDIHM